MKSEYQRIVYATSTGAIKLDSALLGFEIFATLSKIMQTKTLEKTRSRSSRFRKEILFSLKSLVFEQQNKILNFENIEAHQNF